MIRTNDTADLVGDTPVRVYRNLHSGMFSVQTHGQRGWRVHHHSSEVFLRDARFSVSDAGRNRVLNTRRKNVHAYVRGTTISRWEYSNAIRDIDLDRHAHVTYDPYKAAHFYFITGAGKVEAVETAAFVRMTAPGTVIVWAAS